jgi:hypothetical protein
MTFLIIRFGNDDYLDKCTSGMRRQILLETLGVLDLGESNADIHPTRLL